MYKRGEIVTAVTLLVIGIVTMGSVLMGKLSVLPKSTSTRALTCTDTDQGKNYATKGTATDSSGTTVSDYCSGSRTLYESYCNQNGYASYESVDCDKGCSGGVCLSSVGSPTTTPSLPPSQSGTPTLTPPPTQQGKSFSLNYHSFSCTADNKVPTSVTANLHICQGISDKAYYYATGVSTGTLGTKRRDRFVVDPQCANIVYDIPLKPSWLSSSEKDDIVSLYYNFNNQTAFSGKIDFKIIKPACDVQITATPQVSLSPTIIGTLTPTPSASLRASPTPLPISTSTPTPTQVVNRVNVNYTLTVTNPDLKYYVKVTSYTGLAGEGEKECGRFNLPSSDSSARFTGTCYNLVSGRGYTVTAMVYDKTTNQSPNFSLRDGKDITTPSGVVALNLNLNPPTLTPTPQGAREIPVTINVTDPNNNFNLKVFSQEDGSTPKTCFSMPGDSTSGGGPCGSLITGRNYTVYVKLYNLSGGEVAFGGNSVTSKQFTLPAGSFSILFDKIFMPVDLKAPVNLRTSCVNPQGPMTLTWRNTSSVSAAKNQIARYSYGGNPWNYDFGKVAGSATAFSDTYASYNHTYRYMVRSCGDDACTKVSAWSGDTGDVICPAPTSTPTPTPTPTMTPTPTATPSAPLRTSPTPTVVSVNVPTITDFSANEQTMGQSGEIPKCGVVKMYWKAPPPSQISVDGWEMSFYNSFGLQATRFIPVGATCYGCDTGLGSEKWQATVPDEGLNQGEKCTFMAPPSYSDTDAGAHVSLRAVKGNEKGPEAVSNNFYASSINRVWYSKDPTPIFLGSCKQQCGDYDSRSYCTQIGGTCSFQANCPEGQRFSGYCGRQGSTDYGACCRPINSSSPTPLPSVVVTNAPGTASFDITYTNPSTEVIKVCLMTKRGNENWTVREDLCQNVTAQGTSNLTFPNAPTDVEVSYTAFHSGIYSHNGQNVLENLADLVKGKINILADVNLTKAQFIIDLCAGGEMGFDKSYSICYRQATAQRTQSTARGVTEPGAGTQMCASISKEVGDPATNIGFFKPGTDSCNQRGLILNKGDKVEILNPPISSCNLNSRKFFNAKLLQSSNPAVQEFAGRTGIADSDGLVDASYCEEPPNPYLERVAPHCRAPIVGGSTTSCSKDFFKNIYGDIGDELLTYWSVVCTIESAGRPDVVGGEDCLKGTGQGHYVGLLQIDATQHGGKDIYVVNGNRCQVKVGAQAQADALEARLKNGVENALVAREIYNEVGWSAWGAAQSCQIPGYPGKTP